MAWRVSPADVAVVASPARTAEGLGLERFLAERGIDVVRLDALPPASALKQVRDAVVLFTTGFDELAARRWLDRVIAARAGRLVIVVTASLPAFAELAKSTRAPVLLLAAPVLAWQLVDVLRNHLAAKGGGS